MVDLSYDAVQFFHFAALGGHTFDDNPGIQTRDKSRYTKKNLGVPSYPRFFLIFLKKSSPKAGTNQV